MDDKRKARGKVNSKSYRDKVKTTKATEMSKFESAFEEASTVAENFLLTNVATEAVTVTPKLSDSLCKYQAKFIAKTQENIDKLEAKAVELDHEHDNLVKHCEDPNVRSNMKNTRTADIAELLKVQVTAGAFLRSVEIQIDVSDNTLISSRRRITIIVVLYIRPVLVLRSCQETNMSVQWFTTRC